MTIIIATLGATWQVVPEILGLVLPDACPLYQLHPEQAALSDLHKLCGSPSLEHTRLWIVTSSSTKTQQGMEKIRAWNRCLEQPIDIKFFIAANTDEVTTEGELHSLQELVLRVALHASAEGEVIYSLAGGRKTMSADLQYAASLFGARALLHVVAPEPMPSGLLTIEPEFWSQPLPQELASRLLPAFIGRYERRETLDIEPAFRPNSYPLDPIHDDQVIFNLDAPNLSKKLTERQKDAGQVLSNYLASLAHTEKHENWRHLYRLPPHSIELLRNLKVNKEHESLINRLPKAELHCHVGGIPNLEWQIAIGRNIWDNTPTPRQRQLLEKLAPLLSEHEWPWKWPEEWLRAETNPALRAEIAACLLTQATPEQLEHNLFRVTEPRVQLNRSEHGFSAYERPGELTGSSVLGHTAALPIYTEAIHSYTTQENIVYLELRGSPHKYRPENPLTWLKEFQQELQRKQRTNCSYRFIWIVDRRQTNVAEIVSWAVEAQQDAQLAEFIVGIDLAGDESQSKPQDIAEFFTPAFEHCMSVTIHAGEGQLAENIWQAAYHLHADRIGHGLTLAQRPDLLARFRNRNICLELCPTSNIEVIGYAPPSSLASSDDSPVLPQYPLNQLWQSGVAITLNTDNPGISRTGLTQEFLVAAELWREMSLWDCLALIKQGFVHAMVPADLREQLLKQCDSEVFTMVSEWLNQSRANTSA